MIDAVVAIGSHEGFMETASEIADASSLREQLDLATRESLERRGITLPPDARVSLRAFEEDSVGEFTFGADEASPASSPGIAPLGATVCASVGAVVCAAIGAPLPEHPPPRPPIRPGPPYNPPVGKPPPGRPKPVGEPEPAADEAEIRDTLERLNAFVADDAFQRLLDELERQSPDGAAEFIRDVVTNESELRERGVAPPEGVRVQQSSFSDGRPTLFCVSSRLSDGRRKVSITFDAPSEPA
jgi:hypothetical protein